MRPVLIAIFSAACVFASPARAETLFCSGILFYQNSGVTTPIQGHAALLDLESRSLMAPIYGPVHVTRIDHRQISFWKDDPINRIVGALDRISGSLTLRAIHKNISGNTDASDLRNSQLRVTCNPS